MGRGIAGVQHQVILGEGGAYRQRDGEDVADVASRVGEQHVLAGDAVPAKAWRNCSGVCAGMQFMKQVISSVGSWPTQRKAMVPLPLDLTSLASEMIGPKAQRRMAGGRPPKRDLITVSVSRSRSAGSLETSKRSLEAARRLVPPQARPRLRPSASIGRPTIDSPTTW